MAGGDALCRTLASAARLYRPDSFKALLASSATPADLTERFEFDGPWYRRDGLLFAHDKAELVNGAVSLPLNVTENGDYVDTSVALTGAFRDGSFAPSRSCDDWHSSTGIGSGSLANTVAFEHSGGHDWLEIAQASCSGAFEWPLRLYCLSDADVLYHDEFEHSRADL